MNEVEKAALECPLRIESRRRVVTNGLHRINGGKQPVAADDSARLQGLIKSATATVFFR
jgi:hypothetical protein